MKLTSEQILEIIDLYNNGLSCSKIATQFGVTTVTISKHLKRNGIKVVNKQNRTKFNENIFDVIDCEEKAYWLGFIFADGYISSSPLCSDKKPRYDFEISLKASDANHLHKFNKFMQHESDNVKLGKVSCNGILCERCRWSIVNKHLWNTLNNLGCTPQKSLTLKFPNIGSELFISFIRGYFDGDGCLTYYKGDKVYPKCDILGTGEFLQCIRNILSQYQIECLPLHNNSNTQDITKVLTITRKDTMKFLELIYNKSNIYLDRKFYRYQLFKNCRSSKELLELLQTKIGEGCDANPEVIEETKKSSTP